MADPRGHGRASLFDRLIDGHPGDTSEQSPLQTLSPEAFIESVRCEVSRLLNTRNSTAWAETGSDRSVLNYGVIDYTAFYPASQANRRRLEQTIQGALAAFEPRLTRVRVQVHPPDDRGGLRVSIDAMLVAETVRTPISFPVVIRNRDAAIEVQSGE
jgi:type VI secretion system protein ImpF